MGGREGQSLARMRTVEERPLSIRARKKVKAQIEKAERDRLMHLFHKRMDLARNGALQFKQGKGREAVQSYYQYIDILERSKEVSRGKLAPKDFDAKKEIAELLLLSGVFWDLAKLHDRTSTKNLEKLKYYLDRFVMFSKGFPYEKISSELIRKYLVNGKPKNRKEFKDAHIRLGGGNCFIATAVEEHCDLSTLPALRHFRDEVLLQQVSGRIFVKFYYSAGPKLARIVLRMPSSFQKKLASIFDRIANFVS